MTSKTVKTPSSTKSSSKKGGGRWSKEEDLKLRNAVSKVGARNWKRISSDFFDGTRSDVQCLHRWQKVLRPGLVKGPWTKAEDDCIRNCMKNGIQKWSEIALHIPGRIGKQCRERWFNHLDPTIQKGAWTPEEDKILVEAQKKFGNKWSQISKLIPGRAENAVKNRWNSSMRRRLMTNTKKSPKSGKSVASVNNNSVKVKSSKSKTSKSEGGKKRQRKASTTPSKRRRKSKSKTPPSVKKASTPKATTPKCTEEAAATLAMFSVQAVVSPPPSPVPQAFSKVEKMKRKTMKLCATDKVIPKLVANAKAVMGVPSPKPSPAEVTRKFSERGLPKPPSLVMKTPCNSPPDSASEDDNAGGFEVISPVHHKVVFNNGKCAAVPLTTPVMLAARVPLSNISSQNKISPSEKECAQANPNTVQSNSDAKSNKESLADTLVSIATSPVAQR